MDPDQIERLLSNLTNTKNILVKSKVYTVVKLTGWLTKEVLPYLTKKQEELKSNSTKQVREIKRTVTSLINATQSLVEGLEANEASVEDAIELGRDFKVAIAFIEVLAEDLLERQAKEVETDIKGNGVLDGMDANDPVVRKYALYANDMPNGLPRDKPFVIKRMPIIPLVSPPLDIAKLKRLKIAEDHIAYYPVLLNQPVLGLNPAWVISDFKGKTRTAVEDIVATMKLKSGIKYHPMGGIVSLRKLAWAWIPNDKDLHRIQMAAPGGRLNVNKWGFAFNG